MYFVLLTLEEWKFKICTDVLIQRCGPSVSIMQHYVSIDSIFLLFSEVSTLLNDL